MPAAAASALCAKIAACCSAEERMQSVLPQDRAGCEMLLAAEHQSDAETILPAAYGTPLGDPHLHVEVRGAQPPMHVLYFT